jgi:hypothetical protein
MKKILLIVFLAIFLQLENNVFANDNQANATVNVTFRVDMTGQDASQGVYLTGTFTGWYFTPMIKEGSTNIYSVNVSMTTGNQEVYYYKNAANWNPGTRETVPAECAKSNTTTYAWPGDRAVFVPAHDSIISNTYSSCASISNTALVDNFVQDDIQIFPNPAKDFLSVMLPEYMKEASITIFTLDGRKVISNPDVAHSLDINICVSDVKSGLYLLEIHNKQKSFVRKINIQ